MTETLYRHQDGQNLAELRNYKLVQGQLFKLNGKNHYRGAAPYPVPPGKGDTWDELDVNNNWLGAWFWNGVYWLSTNLFEHALVPIIAGIGAVNSNTSYPIDTDTHIFITRFSSAFYITAVSTATNYYQFSLGFFTADNFYTQLAQLTTIGYGTSAGAWARNSVNNIGFLSSDTAVSLTIKELRPAGNINRVASHHAFYRKVRK